MGGVWRLIDYKLSVSSVSARARHLTAQSNAGRDGNTIWSKLKLSKGSTVGCAEPLKKIKRLQFTNPDNRYLKLQAYGNLVLYYICGNT